jgi:predicted ATPase
VRHELSVLLKGPIAADLVEGIYTKTEGNPFLVAEMARFLVTTEAIVWNGRYWSFPDAFDRSAESESMSIDDVLLAEIRKLPKKAQTLLQAAAACGHTFWAGLLRSVLGYDPGELLNLLAEKDVIFAQARSRYRGEQEYAFRHFRVRRTVYRQIDAEALRTYHAAVSSWLQDKGGQKLTDAAWIAFHSARAGDIVTEAAELERLASEASRWEHANALPWSKWPEEPSSGVFTTSG